MAQGGKSFQDRELAAKVRSLTLEEIKKVLTGKDEEYKKQLVLKMSTSILPRLNEHTGEDGRPLVVKFDNAFTGTSKENS